MKNQSMRINELSNEWKLVRDVKKKILNLFEDCDNSSFKDFFDGKINAYNHCVRLLSKLEDEIERLERIKNNKNK